MDSTTKLKDITNNIDRYTKWKPKKIDINWVENLIKQQKKDHIKWVTSHYTILISKKEKVAVLVEVNKPQKSTLPNNIWFDVFEEFGRSAKCLKKLNYKIIAPSEFIDLEINTQNTTGKRILNGLDISDTEIPNGQY